MLDTKILDRLSVKDSEHLLLGAILHDMNWIDAAEGAGVSEDVFSTKRNSLLWSLTRELWNRGEALDLPGISQVAEAKQLSMNGVTNDWIGELYADYAHVGKDCEWHIEHIVDSYRVRKFYASLVQAAKNINAWDHLDAPALISESMREVDDGASALISSNITSIGDYSDKVRETARPSDHKTGVLTGYQELDEITGGMHNGELTILAGRPSHGKSSLAYNIMHHVADRGRPVGVISCEVSPFAVATTMVSYVSNIPGIAIRRHQVNDIGHLSDVDDAADKNKDLPIFFFDQPSHRLADVRRATRYFKRINNIELLIVDYLQLVRPDDTKIPRHEQVAQVSAGLKEIAREYDIPVLALCQINRSVEGRSKEEKEPELHDLKESGAIEQDADTVLVVWRPSRFGDKTVGDSVAMVKVAKQRHGGLGTVCFEFNAAVCRFTETGLRGGSNA